VKIVKIRRVGNSNVISLPHEFERLGFTPGTSVLVEELESGELRVIPASQVRALIQRAGHAVIAENREALAILADHDRRADAPAGRHRQG